jgi:deazaflavin-dependent oxidoreductase (nitroreductase family)
MAQLTHRPNRVQQFLQFIPKSKSGAWLFARTLHHFDRPVLRLSHGRYSLTSALAGLPVVTVTTIGAKSGQPRSLPLVAIPDGENVILIASNFGQHRHPAWYYNLCAHPEVQLTYEGKTVTYLARKTDDAERARCWQRAVEVYSGYALYEEHAGQRQIGVFWLTRSP